MVLIAAGAGSRPSPFPLVGASPAAQTDIPPTYLTIYRRAAGDQHLDWTILAAIGKVETDHGRSNLPGVRSGVNCAGAAGPMQMGIGAGDHGCGDAGNAWATYATDGDGDGRRDVYDPADAVPAAASYLRAAGAPDDYRRAIFAYNRSDHYVAAVFAWGQRYRASFASSTRPGEAQRVPFTGRWLAPLPGTSIECDARIVDDVIWLTARFGLTVTACFAATGHALRGEHPLGLAVDVVPRDREWSRTLAAARYFGWSEHCAAAGCIGVATPPMRVVLYNDFPGHGDPTHCPPPACRPHLHLSWAHGPAEPATPAPWAD
ncbi:MAG: hypothetical protein QOJ82_3227, partial [Solirubrobacteraceae bacterium]|nr:hypothetical protein [Solirubrobacteraceae bacterium]